MEAIVRLSPPHIAEAKTKTICPEVIIGGLRAQHVCPAQYYWCPQSCLTYNC